MGIYLKALHHFTVALTVTTGLGCSPINGIVTARSRGDDKLACELARAQSHTPEGAVYWAECLHDGLGGVPIDHNAADQYLTFAAKSGNNEAAQELQNQGKKIPPEYFLVKEAEQQLNEQPPLFLNGPASCYGAWGGRWGYYGGRMGYGCW